MVDDLAGSQPRQLRPKFWIGQQIRGLARTQIERQPVGLGYLRIKDVDGLGRRQTITPKDLFGAIFSSNVYASTKEGGFCHVLNLVPFVLE